MTDLKCGTCKYWHKETVPNTIIGGPVNGRCRYGPPAAIAVQQGMNITVIAQYIAVADNFPACSKREEVNA
jgi:hypothetical protein